MAFEEFGVMPELVHAAGHESWSLATDVQGEAIPIILGGGDVMVAAETGSGKTGAFVLPLLQLIHETRRAAATRRQTPQSISAEERRHLIAMASLDAGDRDRDFAVSEDGLKGQSRRHDKWAGARATVGVKAGAHYFEAEVSDEGICRAGWAARGAAFNLGTDAGGFGYGGTAMKSNGGSFQPYGAKFGKGDIVGCTLDLVRRTVSFSRNGVDQGVAFSIPASARGPFFPAVAMRNGEVGCAFGGDRSPLRYAPPEGAKPVAEASPSDVELQGEMEAQAAAAGASRTGKGRPPLAVVVEPTRDLTEQTYGVFTRFGAHLREPAVSSVLMLGGPPEPQKRALAAGCDVVVGTPQRLHDFAKKGLLDVSAVRFFVLDEADQLLTTEAEEEVMKLFALLPRNAGTRQTERLQVCFFSATLHSPEVRKYADALCHRPVWVDLKGRDAVPETVHHLVVEVDPDRDADSLSRGQVQPVTDGVHGAQGVGPGGDSDDARSERIKRLKQIKLLEVIEALDVDQCLLFCRTNVDCDSLERFLVQVGGGQRFTGKREGGKENKYSCVVLAGMRGMEERRRNLQAFHEGDVRFLICTDVAARGLDVRGLPYVINVTLPDRSENYIHRIGRVGRLDRLGLAISLVATRKERVWFHTCNRKDKGRGCRHVKLVEDGGCTIWYDEPMLLREVEGRLGQAVTRVEGGGRFALPPSMRLKYGEEVAAEEAGEEALKRLEELRPSIQMLGELEVESQRAFLSMPAKFGGRAAV